MSLETIDASAEVDLLEDERSNRDIVPAASPLVRALLVTLGSLALVLGVIGIAVPVLPTTPFLLIAAACYARSSNRFYQALLSNRYFGPYIKAWRLEHRIPLHAKIMAVTMIVVSLGFTIIYVVPLIGVKILLAIIGLCVILYICHFPN